MFFDLASISKAPDVVHLFAAFDGIATQRAASLSRHTHKPNLML